MGANSDMFKSMLTMFEPMQKALIDSFNGIRIVVDDNLKGNNFYCCVSRELFNQIAQTRQTEQTNIKQSKQLSQKLRDIEETLRGSIMYCRNIRSAKSITWCKDQIKDEIQVSIETAIEELEMLRTEIDQQRQTESTHNPMIGGGEKPIKQNEHSKPPTMLNQ